MRFIAELLKIWAKADRDKREEIRHSWPELGEALDNLELESRSPMVQAPIRTEGN